MNSETILEPESQTAARPAPPNRQRVRITFARDEKLKYIGHLDMARTWRRILRRADLPLAYSEGFNPQPKLTFAAALPLGCTSEHEVLDVVLSSPRELSDIRTELARALPSGMQLISIEAAPVNAPALQTQLLATEYVVSIGPDQSIEELAGRVRAFVESSEVVRERRGKTYNLRPLVQALSLERAGPEHPAIRMRLQATAAGNGRPDEVLAALGLDPAQAKIHRSQLFFLDKTA